MSAVNSRAAFAPDCSRRARVVRSHAVRTLGVALFLGLPLACARIPAPESPLSAPHLPGPGRARGLAMAQKNRECERCHAEVASEWRASPHRRSDLDPAYQRALAREPLPFCRSCHAPEADPAGPAPRELSELGVGCVTCHLDGDRVLAAPSTRPGPERAPHAVRRDAGFASERACASCHEFPFPDSALRLEPELMQSTVSEHAKSPLAERSCASCHMPRVGGRRHHGFRSQRSQTALRSAVRVRATRIGPQGLALELESVGVGHALPTGDLFRRLELSVEAVGDDYASVARSVRYLTRHYQPLGRAGVPRRVLEDDRLGADGTTRTRITFELPVEARNLPLAWRVAYQRVEHPRGVNDESAVLESEVVLAEGILPAEMSEP